MRGKTWMIRRKADAATLDIFSGTARDKQYLEIFISPLAACSTYKPKLGTGSEVDVTQFQALYGADPFYSWIGLDSELMYAAHKAAGGMTSIYRQIGTGGERLFHRILMDQLGLTAEQAKWTYTVPAAAKKGEDDEKERILYLDGRIELAHIADSAVRARVQAWINRAAVEVKLPTDALKVNKGVVFEVRQGYKSKDAKRQNADVANAASAYAFQYIPVVVLLSTQIDGDVASRYRAARWLLLTGTVTGTDVDSVYVFCKDVLGYDLAGFFKRHSAQIKVKLEEVLKALLSA